MWTLSGLIVINSKFWGFLLQVKNFSELLYNSFINILATLIKADANCWPSYLIRIIDVAKPACYHRFYSQIFKKDIKKLCNTLKEFVLTLFRIGLFSTAHV